MGIESDIADYLISLANQKGVGINLSKLQKLAYYAQAWHLALHDSPLFDEDFEAWIHGPTLRSLQEKYKAFGPQPIEQNIKPDIPESIATHLEEIADKYFHYEAYQLELMTHAETPWRRARAELKRDEPSHEIIEKEWMREYYRRSKALDELAALEQELGT